MNEKKKYWWNDTDGGELRCSDGNLSQRQIVHHTTHINLAWD
jgi:hypothetical protein